MASLRELAPPWFTEKHDMAAPQDGQGLCLQPVDNPDSTVFVPAVWKIMCEALEVLYGILVSLQLSRNLHPGTPLYLQLVKHRSQTLRQICRLIPIEPHQRAHIGAATPDASTWSRATAGSV
ncbi:hypothetical protein XA68_13269 [Ophiocordyceps unilateralis]|uniref:Uncharacterized protein n=1 Tax=Ophiocordyceps unilateralis TaxID=268505 RepID=A0A2A9PNS3_OPHUN|nr:hypothetical protein XA68_13269 [Ophiocordyceps unilateralis]